MAGNKVDNSKKKKVTMKDRQSEEGKRLIKEYGGPKTFNREQLYQHMQKKMAENQQVAKKYSEEIASQKSTNVKEGTVTSRINSNTTSTLNSQLVNDSKKKKVTMKDRQSEEND